MKDPSISTVLQQDDDDDDDDGGAGGGDDGGGGDDDGGAGGGDDGGAGGGDDDGGAGGGDDGGAGGGDDDDGPGGDDGGRPGNGGGRATEDDPVRAVREDLEDDRAEFRDERGYRARTGEILLINPANANIEASRRLGFAVVRSIRLQDLGVSAIVLKAPRRQTTIQALRRLRRADPSGRYDYNHLYDFRPTLELKSPYQPGVEEAPRRTLSKQSDLSIGIIDTAVYANHPVLKGAWIEQKTFHKSGGGAPADHGTAVVSVLADNRDGLLPNSRLYVAGVFGVARQGDPVSSVVELATAIDWLVERNVAVINMSLAGPPNALLEAAVERAQSRGHAIVAAVGNAGPNAQPLFPAAYPGVVGVTATDVRKQIFRRALQGAQVDFAAPGVAVRAANGNGQGESLYSGTSFATPYVAAHVAINLKRPNASLAASAIKTLVMLAKDLGTPGRDDTFGYGLIEP
jgi:subtilisin family serine protease